MAIGGADKDTSSFLTRDKVGATCACGLILQHFKDGPPITRSIIYRLRSSPSGASPHYGPVISYTGAAGRR